MTVSKTLSKKLFDVDLFGSRVLIVFGFSLPLSVAVNNMLAGILILLWIVKGDYKKTMSLVANSKVLIAILAFYALHIVGLLWTEDIAWGLHIIKKEWILLLLPIMMSFSRKEHIRYYITAFLLAMTLSEVLSYLVWLEVIPPLLHATVYDPTPFMHHTSYNPFLAFAVYLVGYLLLFDKGLNGKQKVLLMIFITTMSINMFITGGRAGQVGYLVVVSVLFFQYFNKHFLLTLLLVVAVLGSVLFVAYTQSQIFRERVELIRSDIKQFDENKNTSVGLRLNFALNSLEIIKQNPWLGVGTGDFKNTYKEVNTKNTPNALVAHHPHNMYLLETVQFGIVGLLALLFILYAQIRFSLSQNDHQLKHHAGIALVLLFSVIMLSDCYLLGHYTTMLFVYFSAFLYKPEYA